MKCKYRFCDKQIKKKEGPGRNRKFCDDKCKHMEQYYKGKDRGKGVKFLVM